ncbi:CDP-glycerol glycerophosphotransferase family protein [Proteus vulgaris]|uniref:CDP-glycerol glycerophosphotransferase family protein n=1 Tax=Proteus vulgaris TaxID=585 RepID=UPI0025406D10|nr:CDP-glycerol glycerophosphotransferase family protein [Proteus vulgaris]WIF72660.1 CDP-glycerol glycerophosphotransferase family protein [Proteus vulgaris]
MRNISINKLLCKMTSILLRVIPKKKKKAIFIGYPDYDDMLRGLLPHIKDLKLTVLVDNKKKPPFWVNNYRVKILKKKSLSGFFSLLSAEIVFFTHGIYSFYPTPTEKRQKIINLWHGMPLKNIGYLDRKNNVPGSHYTIATSVFFSKIMAEAFNIPRENVLICGLPRNDILFLETKNPYLLTLKKEYNKIVCWMPTYRHSQKGDFRFDGEPNKITEQCINELNLFFHKNNSLLVLKPHPMDMINYNFHSLSNIKIITNEILDGWQTTVYELLSITDALWTDYSSVFIDYIVTKKPIIFITQDLTSYKKSRGFTYPIINHPLPGKQFTTIEGILQHSFDSLFDNNEQYLDIYHDDNKFRHSILDDVINR